MDHAHSKARLVTIGSSDAFNHCGRANSCFWVDDELGSYLLDCGPTTPMSLQQLKKTNRLELSSLDTIYLTHLHGDHIGGLPVLLLELHFSMKRTQPLVIAGPTHTEERVKTLCGSCYPNMLDQMLGFDIDFVERELKSKTTTSGRIIHSIPAQHDPNAFPTSLKIESPQSSITFSGDTGWHEDLIDLSKDADAFVLECSYETAIFPGHVGLDEIAAHRSSMTPKRLILTHFGEASRHAASQRKAELNIQIADDGMAWLL